MALNPPSQASHAAVAPDAVRPEDCEFFVQVMSSLARAIGKGWRCQAIYFGGAAADIVARGCEHQRRVAEAN